METGSLTAHPGKYLEGDYSFASISNETSPVGKGANNTTYAQITLKTGTNAETWVYWPFDLSAIPSNATIDSVSCSAKATVSTTNSSHIKSRTIQLYSGTTMKGSATDLTNSDTAHNLDCGTWTRAELQDCRLRMYARRSQLAASTDRYLYFYGADLTVTYTYKNEKFMLKMGGSWTDVARVFKNVSGIWVEQTDLANVIEDGVRYKNGGEIIVPQTVKVTGTGSTEYAYAKIDGEIFTSATTKTVAKGDIVELYIGADSGFTSNGNIVVDGVEVKLGVGTYQFVVDSDCTIALNLRSVSGAVSFGYIVVTTT